MCHRSSPLSVELLEDILKCPFCDIMSKGCKFEAISHDSDWFLLS